MFFSLVEATKSTTALHEPTLANSTVSTASQIASHTTSVDESALAPSSGEGTADQTAGEFSDGLAMQQQSCVLNALSGAAVQELTFIHETDFTAVPELQQVYDDLLSLSVDELAQRISAPSLDLNAAGGQSDDDGTFGQATRNAEMRTAVLRAIFGGGVNFRARSRGLEPLPQVLTVEPLTDTAHPLRLETSNSSGVATVVYRGDADNAAPPATSGASCRVLGALHGVIHRIIIDAETNNPALLLAPDGASDEMVDEGVRKAPTLPSIATRPLPPLEYLWSYTPGGMTEGVLPHQSSHIDPVPVLLNNRYVLDQSSRCSPAALVQHFETIWGPLHRQALACQHSVLPVTLLDQHNAEDDGEFAGAITPVEQRSVRAAGGALVPVGPQFAAFAAEKKIRAPNVRWHQVTIDGRLPYLVLTTIPGVPLSPGDELLCDKGVNWFRFHSRLNWPRLWTEFLLSRKDLTAQNDSGADGSTRSAPVLGLMLSELPRRLVCSACIGSEPPSRRSKLLTCSGCNAYFHQECLAAASGKLSFLALQNALFCQSCVQIAEKVFGIWDGGGGSTGSSNSTAAPATAFSPSITPISPDGVSAAAELIRGDEPPFSLLKACPSCVSAGEAGANVNVNCRLLQRHSTPSGRESNTAAHREQTLSNSLAVAVGGLVAAEERNRALARRAIDINLSSIAGDLSEADIQEALEMWKQSRLKARAGATLQRATPLLVPHVPVVDPPPRPQQIEMYQRHRPAFLRPPPSEESENESEVGGVFSEGDESVGSVVGDSDGGGSVAAMNHRSRSRRSRSHHNQHAAIEGGPQSVAKELLGDDFEPPAGVAVLIEGHASMAEANNRARELRPWPRGVSWNGKRLTWSVRFYAPGGQRVLSTSLPARKHGGVKEAFRKAVTLRSRSYQYVLSRVAQECFMEANNISVPNMTWEETNHRWVATAGGASKTFEANNEQEVRVAWRKAFTWLRENNDSDALAIDHRLVDMVVDKPRQAPLPEGPVLEGYGSVMSGGGGFVSHGSGGGGGSVNRAKRVRETDIDVLPPPTEVMPCGQNLSLPSPYYSQDVAVMTAEMEAEVRTLPENDKVKWYRQKRGFNASIYGQSKWFSAYSRGVHNAYNMAVAWLERKKAEGMADHSTAGMGQHVDTVNMYRLPPSGGEDNLSASSLSAHRQQQHVMSTSQFYRSYGGGRRTRSGRNSLDCGGGGTRGNSPVFDDFTGSYDPSGGSPSGCDTLDRRRPVSRTEKPLNPGVRQMMEVADDAQYNCRWDSDDSTRDANEQARRLPKISNICWVPQKQAFSVFYTKDPSHSNKTTKAFNPQYYGGVKRSFRQALLFAFAMQLRMHPSWKSKYNNGTTIAEFSTEGNVVPGGSSQLPENLNVMGDDQQRQHSPSPTVIDGSQPYESCSQYSRN